MSSCRPKPSARSRASATVSFIAALAVSCGGPAPESDVISIGSSAAGATPYSGGAAGATGTATGQSGSVAAAGAGGMNGGGAPFTAVVGGGGASAASGAANAGDAFTGTAGTGTGAAGEAGAAGSCPGGGVACGGVCVDVMTTAEHCGQCNSPCTIGQTCRDGQCRCGVGTQLCADACSDTLTDAANCGGCGIACGVGQQCVEGICQDAGAATVGGLADDYPCDGTADGYDAIVSNDTGGWVVTNGGSTVYTGSDMLAAMQAGIDSLSGGRSSKESVLVQGSGSISATSRLNVASYTILNVCGTIDVTGTASGDNAPVYARGRTDIDVPNVTITGSPGYGMFFRDVNNLHLGNVDMRLTGGLGIRVDNHGGDRSQRVTGLSIDSVYVEGASNHGVETYGVDGITIGTVVARHVGYSGLLLNDSSNAEVGLVDGDDVAAGQGYAVFRMANRNGRIGDQYPANIHVGRVIARGGGRGIFCVSESGGAVIDYVDLEGTGNNSVLIENCYNITIGNAAEQSRVASSGELRIAARTEFDNTSDITFQNVLVTGTPVREQPCADGDSNWIDVTADGVYDVCN